MCLQLDDWQKLRLTQQTAYGGLQPRNNPLKFKGIETLDFMLANLDTLYYEILDLPLPELEKLRILRVSLVRSEHPRMCCMLLCLGHVDLSA